MEEFREEIITRMNNIQNRLPMPSFEFEVRSDIKSVQKEVKELKQLVEELLKRIPPPPCSGAVCSLCLYYCE